ncbi:MAG: L-lactate dehydrogenase [Eubacteriales bacterium]|nr:L-lactate dehydrogenase [Eubacteriales bacterium]MDD3881170.1 L-lactate dehydrogenase [Eubacteriales bacterium]MDD4511552.1 L-lactate dehydrogenase [Eubacteriales bacterium]
MARNTKQGNKIAVVGAGQVGVTTAYTLLLSGLAQDIVLIDLNKDKVDGEVMDLRHGIPLLPPAEIRGGSYEDLADSDIVIVSAGVGQKAGETRMQLNSRNIAVMRSIIPEIAKNAPDTIILMVTNPCDVLTYAALKISGFPPQRVIGSGTVLDTSRLRYLLSQRASIDSRNIHTYILGEHGESEFAAWSLTTIAGMPLHGYGDNQLCFPKWDIEKDEKEYLQLVRGSAQEIIAKKGATFYAVAVAVKRICEAILRDENSILTVSTLLSGEMGIKDVCLSLPCRVGIGGVSRKIDIALDEDERRSLDISAKAIRSALDEVGM